MFKEKFNSLYVAVSNFVLLELHEKRFNTIDDEIIYYHRIVDEYNILLFTIMNLYTYDLNNDMLHELDQLKLKLISTFEKLKLKSSIINSYLLELENSKNKIGFYKKLYKFEQSLVAVPLNKINIDILQDIISSAKEYIISGDLYYFSNNPFEIDTDLNIIIPIKYTFSDAEKMLSSLYNYVSTLYNQYINKNKTALESLTILEKNIEEKIYTYSDLLKTKTNISIVDLDSIDFYNIVEETKKELFEYYDLIVSMGIYRFYRLIDFFEQIHDRVLDLIEEYTSNVMYQEIKQRTIFNMKLNQFRDYIIFLEDGVINIDASYIITNITFKDLVEELIELSRSTTNSITYTQQYNVLGRPKSFTFEFYQMGLFLNNVKKYYYDLMMKNIYKNSNINIFEIGTESIHDIKNEYLTILKKYNDYLEQDVSFFNEFEYASFYNNIEKLQSNLKSVATKFFTAAINTSPITFKASIESQYLIFLDMLKQDLADIGDTKTSFSLEASNIEKVDANKLITDVNIHIGNIVNIIESSKKHIFLSSTDVISKYIYKPFSDLLIELKKLYNAEKYQDLIVLYNGFYSSNIFDFNFLHTLENIQSQIDTIFLMFDNADNIYINEQLTGIYDENNIDHFNILDDLFCDATYKVSRTELFNLLDILYTCIIAIKPNEKTFLLNEKNLKKTLFDNKLLKMNYTMWYHKIIYLNVEKTTINPDILCMSEWYNNNNSIFDIVKYKDKLEILISQQNKTIAMITKMINEYSSDNNYTTTDNFDSNIIKNIDEYNKQSKIDIETYTIFVEKLKCLERFNSLKSFESILIDKHTNEWISIIDNNNIDDISVVSYNEMSPIQGNIPLTVLLEAKLEKTTDSTGKNISATYSWYFDDNIIKNGNKITHTFYSIGKQKVKCEIIYASGETATRYIEFDLNGPENSQIVKSGVLNYAPLELYNDQPKITYKNPKTGLLITIPINITGDITKMIDGEDITVSTLSDDLKEEKVGLIILGFNGSEIAGQPYDYTNIFTDDFSFPEENEFLFDFNISSPISGNCSLNIGLSKYTQFMSKVSNTINSVYEIDKASDYSIGGDVITIAAGDKIILKNSHNRYAVLHIKDIKTIINSNDKKYHYEINIEYFVNVSLSKYNRDVFKPNTVSMTIPTIVFKTNIREMFSSLIDRLSQINILQERLTNTNDVELAETIELELSSLTSINNNFYLFGEMDKIKSKIAIFEYNYNQMMEMACINFDEELKYIIEKLDLYQEHLNNTKSFEMYMNSVESYDFKKNIIDLNILISLYNDQKTILEIIIDSYEYNKYDLSYFKNKLASIKMFNIIDTIDLTSNDYNSGLVIILKALRTILFKIKLIINFPIMINNDYIVLGSEYKRLQKDDSTGLWEFKNEDDLFLLNKKLELKYGYEIGKFESNKPYKSFITDVVTKQKMEFGKGLSINDTQNITKYIQTIETLAIDGYDDFFMLPFWIDYIEKNV